MPAKLVAEAVRKLPAGAVAFTTGDGEVEATGNGRRFNLREFDANDCHGSEQALEVVVRAAARFEER